MRFKIYEIPPNTLYKYKIYNNNVLEVTYKDAFIK